MSTSKFAFHLHKHINQTFETRKMRLNFVVLASAIVLYASNDLVAADTTRNLLSLDDISEERASTTTKTSEAVS
ncbi:hypothetical protein F441_02800, partial [Phytophthora nicotianae CJ01A1]